MSEHDHHLTRRGALGIAGAGGVALLFGGLRDSANGRLFDALGPEMAEAASGACTMTPAKTVGPYFVDEKLDRRDVRSNTGDGAVQPGVPLTLKLQVFDADGDCAPVKGAIVDIWHANASGRYSDEAANGTSGQDWLRGYQTTDADGIVTFTTIYPGWYTGRAVHIHFKVRTDSLEFTSQLFFTDKMNDHVFATFSPYKERSRPTPDTTDSTDNIYGADGSSLLLSPVSDGNGGYSADFSVGVSKSASTTPATPSDSAVSAVLASARMVRTVLGKRQLNVTIRASEPVAVTARLARGSRPIVTRKASLDAGTRTVKLFIPTTARAGAAKLRLTLTDGAGNAKRYARTVHVHTA
jgi:protocatechuate 3,4-dioxygenase beta subunit